MEIATNGLLTDPNLWKNFISLYCTSGLTLFNFYLFLQSLKLNYYLDDKCAALQKNEVESYGRNFINEAFKQLVDIRDLKFLHFTFNNFDDVSYNFCNL